MRLRCVPAVPGVPGPGAAGHILTTIGYLLGTALGRRDAGDATRRGLSWQGLAWTRHAPPAHMLTIDWQGPREDSFRVSDWETFNLQMLRAMGVR